jgi:CBS domain-containing protein
MHRGLVSCASDTTLRTIAALMARHRIHCVVVFDYGADADFELFGIVTDRDVARAIADGTLDLRTAENTAVSPVRTVHADDDLRVAAEVLAAGSASHVIVTDRATQRPVGVLSTLDLARVVAR